MKRLDMYTDAELVAMPRVNLELLDHVLDYIIEHPDEWDQSMWAITSSQSSCGTTMCFAGHACALAGEAVTADAEGNLLRNGDPGGWFWAGMDYLGLTKDEAHRLFYDTITVEELNEVENPTPEQWREGQLRNVKVEVERIRARALAQEAAFNRLAQEFIDAAGLDDVVKPGYECPESSEVLQGIKGGASE